MINYGLYADPPDTRVIMSDSIQLLQESMPTIYSDPISTTKALA